MSYNPGSGSTEKSSVSAQAQLLTLARKADEARTSGTPAQVAQANDRLIAFALRMMGQLRLLEGAYPQAIELYTESLRFQDVPDAHIDLAIAEFSGNQAQAAILESEKALALQPNDLRAETVLGRAYMSEDKYGQAAEAFSKADALRPGNIELEYAWAIALLGSKDPQDKQRAAAVFEKMIRSAGDSGSLHVLFGRAYRDAGYMPDAVREFQRAIHLDPSTPHAHYFLGLARLMMNEWKPTPEAAQEFQAELRYYPRDFLANYMLGFLASSQRDYETSDRYLHLAAQINPEWPESWLYLGLNDFAQGRMPQAEAMLRKAIALTGQDESRSNYQIRRAYIDIGRILASSGHQEEADRYLKKARELENKALQADQQGVATLASSRGGLPMAAIVPLDKQRENQAAPLPAASADPFARLGASLSAHANLTAQQLAAANTQENNLRLVLGQSFSDLATSEAVRGEYGAALGHYQEAARWSDAIPGLARNLGQCAYRLNQYSEAARWLSRALADNPQAPNSIRAMLGMAYFATDKYADAARTFAPLGVAGMQDPTVGYTWADALGKMGDFKQASAVLRQYQSAQLPTDTLLLVGELWIEIGDYAQAVDTFHRALQADPNLLQAHYHAGEADIHWERWPEAAQEFQAELALDPGDVDARYDLGFVDLQMSKVQDAEAIFQQVLATHPDYANAQYQMGKILLQQGQLQQAVTHLEAAARLSPDKDYIHYQLQAAYRKESRIADADRELAIYSALKARSHAPQAAPAPSNP